MFLSVVIILNTPSALQRSWNVEIRLNRSPMDQESDFIQFPLVCKLVEDKNEDEQ